MVKLKAPLNALSIIGVLSLSACSQANTNGVSMADAAVKESPAKSYAKPGPALDMRSDYPGYSAPGKAQTIHITFTHAYPGGLLSVKALPVDGLNILAGANAETRRLADRQNETLVIEIMPTVEGLTPLNILTDIETADGQQMKRSFVIMVNSVSPNLEKIQDAGKPKLTQPVQKSDDSVIMMPAEEEIIDRKGD